MSWYQEKAIADFLNRTVSCNTNQIRNQMDNIHIHNLIGAVNLPHLLSHLNVEGPKTASNYEEDRSGTNSNGFKNFDTEGWLIGKSHLTSMELLFGSMEQLEIFFERRLLE